MTDTETTPAVKETKQQQADRLLAELDEIRPVLQEHQDEAKRLSDRRIEIQVQLRKLHVPDRVMAEHSGQNVGTVTQAIRAYRLKARGTPISRTNNRKR